MYGDKFKEATHSLMSYCREQMGYDKDPDVHYVTDSNNANNMLGYTAHYQPEKRIVTVYISNRHPKDVLRSLSHELVHHAQNCRGDLQNTQTEEGYAQKDPHMRKMEEEAYLKGNMMFRDWEDSCKEQNMILPSTIGENKMSDQLNNLIAEKVKAKLEAEGIQLDEGFLDRLRAKAAGFAGGAKQVGKNLGALGRAAKAGLSGDADAARGALDSVSSVGAAKKTRAIQSRMKGAAKSLNKVIDDIENDLQKLGLADDERISGSNSALSAMRALRTKMTNVMGELLRDAAEVLGQEDSVQTEDALEEGGAAQRQGNEDRLRRQEPDRIKEEDEIEEEKKKGKFDDGDGKDEKCDYVDCDDEGKKDVEEGRRTYGSRPKGDKPHNLSKDKLGSFGKDHEDRVDAAADKKHKEELAAARARLEKNPDSYKVKGGRKKKKVKENELAEIKKGQDSIKNLNEQRNQKLNDELMRRLLK